ncbi:MAG TPA: hypothetical protein DCX46_06655 [Bacteroidetes bacterium]|nr:MAG: hypothetical protein A2X68_09155 [Ignavibacteria bacterium GWC2_56_12]HAV23161.1 hypothetical protein [Bacteroidota bacterium]
MQERLYHMFGGARSAPFVDAVTTFLAVLVAGWVLKVFFDKVVRKIVKRTQTTLDDSVLAIFVPSLRWFTLIIALTLGIDQIQGKAGLLTKSAQLILLYVDHLLYAAGVLIIAILFIRLSLLSLEHVLRRYDKRGGAGVNEALNPLLERLVNILGLLLAATIILDRFGINVSSLLVFLGGSSVAIALAAQETLSNMISGFVIMIDRPFRVGDRIKLPTGETGDVYEIGLRSTRIMDFDNNLIISPNAELVKAKVVNYAYPQRLIRVKVDVNVAYGTDIKRARTVLEGLAKRHPDVLRDPVPEVFVTALGESAVALTLIARTDDFMKKFKAEADIREQILESFPKDGIDIPFPQRVVTVKDERHSPKAS